MYSTDECDFIKKLAEDYTSARTLQASKGSRPKAPAKIITTDDELRKIGSTNYALFDQIAQNDTFDEAIERFKSTQREMAARCTIDHTHGPECNQTPSSCSHDHSKERSIFEKPFAEKMDAARLFREEGNISFKSKNYLDALASYKRAMVYLDYTIGDSDEQDDAVDAERVKCYLNMAAVNLELLNFSGAINNCRLAIQLDANNSKAHFRMGMAYLRQDDLERAQECLYKAMKLTSTEPAEVRRPIESAVRELNVKWRQYKKKTADIAKAAIQ